MGVSHASVTPLYFHCDNRCTMHNPHNDVFHEYTKHIENDCHFIRHHVLQDIIRLIYVSFRDQIVDIFTKSHSPGHFHDLVSKLQLADLLPP